METLLQDIRYGLRMLRKSPAFTAVALLTLTIGIGANVAIFSIVNTVLLQPLPYRDPGRLVMVYQSFPAVSGMERLGASPPDFLDYRARNRVFENIGGYSDRSATLTGEGDPERVQGARVTASVFPLLGVSPLFGRTFTEEEDRQGAGPVVVLSYSLWHRRFRDDPSVIGRAVRLDDQPYTIIGVMPRSFAFPFPGTPLSDIAEFWVPMAFTPHEQQARAESYDTRTIARLKPGVSLDQTEADVTRIAGDIERENPQIYNGNFHMKTYLRPLEGEVVAKVRPMLLIVLGAVGFVLLIACVNVANLLLARASGRSREIAIRSAIGATAGRLSRQLLTESVVLAVTGGVFGLGLTYALVTAITAFGPQQVPRLADVRIDAIVLLFALGVSILTGLLFGIAPAMRVSRVDLNIALKESGQQTGSGRDRHRYRSALVIIETACALLLLVGAGLLVNSFIRVLRVPPGFNPQGVLVVRTAFDAKRYPTAEARYQAQRPIIERLAHLPGVQAVGLTTHLPLADMRNIGFNVEGSDPKEVHIADSEIVTGDYFRSMGVPLLAGRTFNEQDSPAHPMVAQNPNSVSDKPLVAVINQTMARQYWPAGEAIGKRFRWAGRPFTVIGIAADVKLFALDAETEPTIFMDVFQIASGASFRSVFTIRTAADPASLADSARREIWAVDKDLPVFDVHPMTEVVAASLAQRRFTMLLLAAFAGVALLLAAIGLYGVLSYSVAQRMHEMGLRMALGAKPRDLVALVVGNGVRLAAIGVIVGLAASVALTRLLAKMLFGVSALDPATFVAVSLLLLAVAVSATYIPARRASRIDPMVALRNE